MYIYMCFVVNMLCSMIMCCMYLLDCVEPYYKNTTSNVCKVIKFYRHSLLFNLWQCIVGGLRSQLDASVWPVCGREVLIRDECAKL